MENCVVRTYRRGYITTTGSLESKLMAGWVVKMALPYTNDAGGTEYIEYILERVKSVE